MKKINKIIFKILVIIFANYSYAYSESKNELSFGIAIGNGIMENVKGMHTPVTGNPGTNVKGLVLDDDSLNTIYSLSIDYYKYLKKHNLLSVKLAQKQATINVFQEKGIPFRNFEVLKKNEETLGELFTFFMLETILLGKMLRINPYDQPAVELIKKETKKILI